MSQLLGLVTGSCLWLVGTVPDCGQQCLCGQRRRTPVKHREAPSWTVSPPPPCTLYVTSVQTKDARSPAGVWVCKAVKDPDEIPRVWCHLWFNVKETRGFPALCWRLAGMSHHADSICWPQAAGRAWVVVSIVIRNVQPVLGDHETGCVIGWRVAFT